MIKRGFFQNDGCSGFIGNISFKRNLEIEVPTKENNYKYS